MSTSVELPQQTQINETRPDDLVKSMAKTTIGQTQQQNQQTQEKNQHPLHQYDLSVMKKFYESCVGKFKEQNPKWKPTEWAQMNPVPHTATYEQRTQWPNPMVISQKQRVYEAFAKLARESGEPMILMPNFDYGDIANFERFLQALKQDGVNAIGKYKQYLNNKDMRKFEVDLVVVHPRYGVLLFEVKECDHLDNKRRSKAKVQLSSARSCFESMGRLIVEANGWTHGEAQVQVTEFIVLPNVQERPVQPSKDQHLQTQGGNHNNSASSTTSQGRSSRQLNYVIRKDLENSVEFAKWWTTYVVEPKVQHQQQQEADNKQNKFDLHAMNAMIGLINCVRNNSIMPVVYQEAGSFELTLTPEQQKPETKPEDAEQEKDKQPKETTQFQPALNVHGEFFQVEHESVRSLSKVVVVSKDSEKLRKTLCLQTLWFLLNDSQKKISVVCSEMNKAYYEEFFARQRKLYNNLNNLRFYVELQSCAVEEKHTLRKDGEIWFFDSGIKASLTDVMERVKDLNAFWIYTTQEEFVEKNKPELEKLNSKIAKLDVHTHLTEQEKQTMPWLTGTSLKFPLRLQCDLLIIGDIIGLNQLKPLYRYLKNQYVTNQANQYQQHGQNDRYHHYQQPQQQQLSFNPSKKFKTVKFIRGGTIDNLRNSLKMHDSIQAQVILMHVGDEDLFKTRNSPTTIERVKEFATLVKEYCPKSFIVLSTLMRRNSRTENGVTNEVNKGIVSFCKQTKETGNFHFMLNNHFEPDYHTQEGRALSNKGLRLYVENLLFMVDHFLVRNNKQH